MENQQTELHTLCQALIEDLAWHNLTISTCESLTAGLCCSSLASVSGASRVLAGGLVTYQNRIKEQLAHVPASLIEKEGVVSMACAKAMAFNTRKLFGTDLCLSFTGNAGPDVLEDKPKGLVYGAIAFESEVTGFEFKYDGSRNEIRNQVVIDLIEQCIAFLKGRNYGKKSG